MECIVFGTKSSLTKVSLQNIQIGDYAIPVYQCVRNIGAMFDSDLRMQAQVVKICKAAWLHIHNIANIRPFLTPDQTKTVIHAYVISKMDSCNSLLGGLPDNL